MRKKLPLLFLILFYFNLNAQVTRVEFGEMIFNHLYSSDPDPNGYKSVIYPNPYLDLNDGSVIGKKIKVLSYLSYNDNVGVFPRSNNFYPDSFILKGDAIRAMNEAWNLPEIFYATTPFRNIDTNHPYYGILCTAYGHGMISKNDDDCYSTINKSEAYDFITWVSNSRFHPVSDSALSNEDNYYLPISYTPENLSVPKGTEQGVFSHYAKNSFAIPDRKLNLNFSHYYSTAMVELPSSYFPIEPLGKGWTHSYNVYLIREDNVGASRNDFYYIKWADGTIHIYNEDENRYISKGVYDTLDEDGSNTVIITKKNQVQYKFRKLDSDKKIFYLTEIKDRNGNEINIDYERAEADDIMRVLSVKSPSDFKLTFKYTRNTDLLEYVIDPIGRKINFDHAGYTSTSYFKSPVLVRFKDAKGQKTMYQYNFDDKKERYLLKRIDLPKGNQIKAKYQDRKLKEYQINNEKPISIDVNFDYKNENTVNSIVTVPMPNGNKKTYNYKYNKNGALTHFNDDVNRLTIEYPSSGSNVMLPNNSSHNGLDIEYEYDKRGNLVEKKVEGRIKETFFYNRDNTLSRYVNPNRYATVFEYDRNGNLISIEDALDNFITIKNDSYGQVEHITNQEGIRVEYSYNKGVVTSVSAPENLRSSFGYDGVNRLITKTVNGQTSSYAYDENDNLKNQTNFAGYTTVFNYDTNDNLTKIVNAKGVATTFTYDDEDQLTSETFGSLTKKYHYKDGVLKSYTKPSGTQISFSYDGDGRLKQSGSINDIGYNGKGLIKRIANNDIRYDFEYNTYNRLERVVDNFNDAETRYGYDDVGNITQIYYPNNPVGFAVYYSYDAKNRLTKTYARINGTEKLIAEYAYRKDDLLKSINFGNGTQKKYNYDDAGRLTGIFQYDVKIDNSRTTLFSQQIQLNPKGNVEKESYHYTGEKGGYTPIVNVKYAYNNNNHITKAGNHELSVDKDGNTVKKGKINYSYDTDDRLINVQGSNSSSTISASYKYDPYGNRIERKSIDNGSGTKYVWDILNNNIIQEKTSHTSLFYVYGASGLECSIDTQTGKIVNYYHGDIRGSVVFTTKNIRDTKKKITFNKYDDFGKIVNGGSGGLADFKYLGKHGILNEHQDEGLYYIKARYYDATLGRFLTQDPIWSTNLYPYANNNPVTNSDTNGKDWYASYSTGVFSGLSGEYYKTSYARCNQTSNPALCKAGKWVGFSGAVLAKIGEIYVNVRIGQMIKAFSVSHSPKIGIWTNTKSKTAVQNAFNHWKKHATEFPEYLNAKQYVQGAKKFLNNSPKGTLTKVRSNGDILKYHPNSNTFGIMNSSRVPKTMFRPTDGIKYWLRQ